MSQPKSMKMLLEGIDYEAINCEDAQITGIANRSDRVESGDLFFCIQGFTSDGHSYAPDAVERGCAALVVQRELDLDIPQFLVEDSRIAMGVVSSRFFDEPSSKMDVVGITGTNGKTTTTYLIDCIANHLGKTTGVIGTIGTKIAGKATKGDRTTPESMELQETFAEMVDAGCDVVAMEVSSHAIDLHRIAGIRFAVAAFSNLTQDHLDYHKTMENYFMAKAGLFDTVYTDRAAICIDGDYGKRLAELAVERGLDVITCGFDENAYVRAIDADFLQTHTRLVLDVGGETVELEYPLIGRFNAENVMVATSACLALGYPLEGIVEALANSSAAPGRLDRAIVAGLDEQPGFSTYVDYAHTPDSIEKALAALAPITKGRIIIVFGCGGDRDRTKRPLMGAAACKADYAIVTSDNPRTEDPSAIIADILPGMEGFEERYEVIEDRRSAINRAIEIAQDDDSILIAGKGHEDYQIVGSQILSFDDKLVACEAIERRMKQGE